MNKSYQTHSSSSTQGQILHIKSVHTQITSHALNYLLPSQILKCKLILLCHVTKIFNLLNSCSLKMVKSILKKKKERPTEDGTMYFCTSFPPKLLFPLHFVIVPFGGDTLDSTLALIQHQL